MKWAYSIREKGKAAFLLALVLVVVAMVAWVERTNVSELGSSFSSVYEDRLVVESYIYKFSDHLYQKKLMLENCNTGAHLNGYGEKIRRHNEAIQAMIQKYEHTKLTAAESQHFADFKNSMREIIALEESMLTSKAENELSSGIPAMEKHVDAALGTLDRLSDIQISEGKSLSESTKKILAGSEMLTQFELAVLIVIGLLIQVLIFASNSLKPRVPQNTDLN